MGPEDNIDQTEIISEVTPLQALAYELNEVYVCLVEADFPEHIAALIVAKYMESSLVHKDEYIGLSDDDEDDEDWDIEEGEA
jgi:hypothetical protein